MPLILWFTGWEIIGCQRCFAFEVDASSDVIDLLGGDGKKLFVCELQWHRGTDIWIRSDGPRRRRRLDWRNDQYRHCIDDLIILVAVADNILAESHLGVCAIGIIPLANAAARCITLGTLMPTAVIVLIFLGEEFWRYRAI